MRRAIQPTGCSPLPHISPRTGSENLQMLAMPTILRVQISAHQPLILSPLSKSPPAKRSGSNNEQSIESSNASTKPARPKRLQSPLSLNIASETNTATTDTNPTDTRRQQPSIRCSRRPVHSQLQRGSQDLHVLNLLENIRQSTQPKRPPENPHRIPSIRMRRLQA